MKWLFNSFLSLHPLGAVWSVDFKAIEDHRMQFYDGLEHKSTAVQFQLLFFVAALVQSHW